MNLEITVRPGAPSSQGLPVALRLSARNKVLLETITVVGLCPQGQELGPRVLVPLPVRLVGERTLNVQLRIGEITPAKVCCRAWLKDAAEPLVFTARVRCEVGYPGLSPELAACLDDVCIDHDEQAFQMFVGDFCQGVDPDELGHDDVAGALRALMFEE